MTEPELFYRKVGKRYKPVGYGEFPHFDQGSHLVVVKNNWTHYKFRIDPDRAALLAASVLAHEKVVRIVAKACEAKYEAHNAQVKTSQAYRDKCNRAWKAYQDIMGDDKPMALWFPSASDIAHEIVDAMMETAKEC